MGVELNFWEETNKRIIELSSLKKLIKRVRFKLLKITRQGGRIERLKTIRVKRKKKTKEKFQERKENQNGLKIASTVHMASTVKGSKI